MPPPTAHCPQPALTAATLLGRRKSSGKQRKFAVFHSRQVITHSSRKSLSLSCRKIENFSFHKMRLKTRADAAAAADNEEERRGEGAVANRKSSFNGGEGLKSEKFTTKIFFKKITRTSKKTRRRKQKQQRCEEETVEEELKSKIIMAAKAIQY